MSNYDVESFLKRWIDIATGEIQEFVDYTEALAAFAIEAKRLMETETLKPDRAVELLDEKYTRWDLYQSGYGGWRVKIPDEILSGDTLSAVLQAAVDYVPLPKYPRQPTPLSIDRFTYHKQGGKWWAQYDGVDHPVAAKAKKKVIKICTRFVELRNQEYDVWRNVYGALVDNGTEGEDFRWEG